jgi:TRAP-type C4-dicarboxylate transport system permease small subunit
MMTALLAGLSRLNARISAVAYVICGALLCVLVGITGWQVWGRYVLNDTPSWVERTALLLILYIALPMAAVGVRERFHMNVVFLLEKLPTRAQKAISIGVDACLLFFGAAMVWYGWVIAAIVWPTKMAMLPLSEGAQYVPLMICGVMTVLFTTEQLLAASLGRRTGAETAALELN